MITLYNGDENVAKDFDYGNFNTIKPYLTTIRSARKEIKQNRNLKSNAKYTYMVLLKGAEHSKHGKIFILNLKNYILI